MDKTTRDVARKTNWTEKQIKARCNFLSKEISRIITGPKNEKNSNNNWL